MFSTANGAAKLGASKMITILFLLAGACCAEGLSACFGGDEYMCVDHTVGSREMREAQGSYYDDTGMWVVFGIGSFGRQESMNMGKCYWMNLDTNTAVIGQVTNYGEDIHNQQFDMQMGGGECGVYNACAYQPNRALNEERPCDAAALANINGVSALYGSEGNWGERCGGHGTEGGCDQLPYWPPTLNDEEMSGRQNMVQLCKAAFDFQVRKTITYQDGNYNPKITSGERIKCPRQIYELTKLRRVDDETFTDKETIEAVYAQLEPQLTSTMDCCASAGTSAANTDGNGGILDGFVPGYNALPSCTNDGYTRYN